MQRRFLATLIVLAGLGLGGGLAGCGSPEGPATESRGSPTTESRPVRGAPGASTALSRSIAYLAGHVSPAALSEHLKQITAKPHVAGSPANRETAQIVEQAFRAAGFETRVDEYDVLIPYPHEITVELLKPVAYRCPMVEEPTDLDYDTHTTAAIQPYLAFAADGDVTAPLVYVNFGTAADYDRLAALGTDLRGCIGIARYGKIYRGTKLILARERGLAGLLIYSDPADDGFTKGPPYPQGPWRPKTAVQRGSVLDIVKRPGDPLTPGGAARPGAMQLSGEAVENLPGLPAAPLSSGDAEPMLKLLDGAPVPEGWQGGLPFAYHVGGTKTVEAHLRTQCDWSTRRIYNVIGTLSGTVAPDEWVLMGSHRDAWVYGAVDSSSGTAVLMELARVIGDAARSGLPPSRSIVLCSWDGEEFGMFGSTEFVEENQPLLENRAVLYLNCDAPVSGGEFRAGGSPELGLLLRGALGQVEDDRHEGRSLLDDLTERQALSLDIPGGGSDFIGFLQQAAVPCCEIGSSGPYGVYHSVFDTYGWMKRFGDPDFRHHARVTRAVGATLLAAANATLLPIDATANVQWIRTRVQALAKRRPALDPTRLLSALDRAEAAALGLDAARTTLVASDPDPSRLRVINRALLLLERSFLAEGSALKSRPFYRHLLVATDPANGYGAEELPGLAEALAATPPLGVEAESARLLAAIDDYTARLVRITGFMQAQSLPAPR